MLGSAAEADDAAQETWLRLSRSDTASVDNLGRVTDDCPLPSLSECCRAAARGRESPADGLIEAPLADRSAPDPEQEALLADSVGVALLVVLDTLTPSERVAFVLQDLSAVPFAEIVPIVGRSEQARRSQRSGSLRPRPPARRERAGYLPTPGATISCRGR
jgi:RNA polymerase sigma-70 factor (ECF subfamily)